MTTEVYETALTRLVLIVLIRELFPETKGMSFDVACDYVCDRL